MDIVSYNQLDDAWMGLDEKDFRGIDLTDHPLFIKEKFFEDNPGIPEVACMKDPRYIGYTAHELLGIKLDPFQIVIQQQLWRHAFPMLIGCRGMSKSFSLGVFALLSCVLNPEYKVIIAGASFRQSKMIFEYVEKLWTQSPMIRSMCKPSSKMSKDVDRWSFRINDSTITAIPIGNGEKIRGLRSNCIIVDEMASHNPQILEEVVLGFGAVASNPIDKVISKAREEKARELGIALRQTQEAEDPFSKNKAIITGTADYYFNHFYEYWNRYKQIIKSKGDKRKLEELFGGDVPEAFNWKEYCVMRIPYSVLPKGFMEDETVARAKAQMPESLYKKEYEAVFVEDSDGFFKRSMIENCVASEKNVKAYNWVPYCPEKFEPVTRGYPDGNYVFGIDPAAKDDNFAVIILEVHPEHNRIVHCWTTNENDFLDRKKAGLIRFDDYYSFCVRRVRDLARVFPTNAIGIDTQGGGYALMERFRDENLLEESEEIFLERIEWKNKKDTDSAKGRHIIYPIQFSNAQWMHEANWGLKADLEGRFILFPNFDPVSIELAIAQDKMRMSEFAKKSKGAKKLVLNDSLEKCIEDIEELKDELTNIIYSRTPAGRERWTVPEVKIDRNKKASGKKDRYSALLIANFLAREARVQVKKDQKYEYAGGLVQNIKKTKNEPLYSGPGGLTISW